MLTSLRTRCSIKRWWPQILALAVLVIGCRSGSGRLVLFVTGDSRGYLEPCGCRRDQAGGLAGRARLIGEAAPDDRLVFDVGNLTAGSRDYEMLKMAYMLKGMTAIGYDAVNLGKKEAELDIERLSAALERSKLPFVSANVVAKKGGQPIVEPFRVIDRQGTKVGVIGVTGCDPEDVGPGLEVRPPLEALADYIPRLKDRCDYLVVLAFCDDEAMREIAGKFHEVDLILGGDVPQPSGAIQVLNRASQFSVTDHGKVIGRLDLTKKGEGFAVQAAKGIKIAADKTPAPQAIATLLASYKNELRERRYELASVEGMERIEAVEGTANEFVGDEKCLSCHQTDHKIWKDSGHSHAFATLVNVKSEFDPDCLRCHTVGYGLSSGFIDEQKTPELKNVQCENCHGRGKDHSASKKKEDLKPVTPSSCVKCHDEENSENFHFKTFWAKIKH